MVGRPGPVRKVGCRGLWKVYDVGMVGRAALVAVMGWVAGVMGCAEQRRAPVAPATRPGGLPAGVREVAPATRAASRPAVAGGGVYEGKGVRMGWPAGWERVGSEDYVLVLKGNGGAEISLDVPKLPAHVPGLIPLGLVVNGYQDDLKKQVGVLDKRELPPPGGVLGEKAKMVRSAWDGGAMQETAVIVVHDDHVYILRGRSDAEHERATRETMGQMVGSWRWVGE